MKPRIELTEDRHTGMYAIVWIVDEDEGAYIGDFWSKNKDIVEVSMNDREEYDVWKTEKVAFQFNPDAINPFRWDSKSVASAALRACRAALKAADKDRPLPDWAVKALSEGWKQPKGWKP